MNGTSRGTAHDGFGECWGCSSYCVAQYSDCSLVAAVRSDHRYWVSVGSTMIFDPAQRSLSGRWPSSCYMTTSDTLVPLHHTTLFGISGLCAIVRLKKSNFDPFCLARPNSTASKRHRLALYPSTLAGPSYRMVKELSQFDKVYASRRVKCANSQKRHLQPPTKG